MVQEAQEGMRHLIAPQVITVLWLCRCLHSPSGALQWASAQYGLHFEKRSCFPTYGGDLVSTWQVQDGEQVVVSSPR